MSGSLPADYFDRLYAQNPDPWDFGGSDYEREKYTATLAALPRQRFHSVFEPGCSIGVLTRLLAPVCERLLAVDFAEAALEQARKRCANLPQVRIERMELPRQWPDEKFDLTVLSEVLYFLSADDIVRTAKHAIRTRTENGVVLLVHWTGETNYPCSGDAAVATFTQASGLACLHAHRAAQYRLDLLG